jgi:hypothetical protein
MGRLTPFFRTVYSEVLDDLRKEMRNCFVDLTHKEAFDLIQRGVASGRGSDGIFNSTLPTVLDKLCMVANINTRKLIEVIKAELKIRETKIQALSEIIDSLERNINDQGRRLEFSHVNPHLQSYVHISRYRICIA